MSGTWLIYYFVVRPLGTSGFSILNVCQMGQLIDINLNWWLRATRNTRELTMKRHSRL